MRALIVALSVVAILPLSATPALAGNGGSERDGVQVTTGPGTFRARVISGPGPVRAPSPCRWEKADSDPYGVADGHSGRSDDFFDTKALLYRRFDCRDPRRNGFIWVPQVDVHRDLVPVVSADVERRLPAPVGVFEPVDPETGWVFVQVPLDVRTAIDTWRPVVGSASIEGPSPVWVEVTAAPVAMTFLPGDPARPSDSVRCSGADPVAAYDPAVPGRCSYTYGNASSIAIAGEVFDARLRIHWRVTYESSAGPGSLDMAPTEATASLAVAEIQAVVACRAGRADCSDTDRRSVRGSGRP